MEGSPLGNAFGDSAGRKKSRKSFLLIAVAAALGLGGTVLAANITINSNQAIEFGQGVAVTAPCDTDMTISPFSVYDESSNNFFLSYIEVSNVAQACEGKNLTVSVFAAGTSAAVYSSTKAYASATPVQTFEVATTTVNTNKVDSITVETNN